jgi:hypothetical protein
VAGNIEAVRGDDWHFCPNEDGKILRLEPNRRAARLLFEVSNPDGCLLWERRVPGETADGSDSNVPERLIDLGQQLFALNKPANQ